MPVEKVAQRLDKTPKGGYSVIVIKGAQGRDLMRRFKVEFVIQVDSVDPQDWITESIVDQLEEGETVEYLNVERVSDAVQCAS